MLSIYGGKLPSIFIDSAAKKGITIDPYKARMKAMFIFALFPILAILAQPLSLVSNWLPIIIIGVAGAAHQSWSANIYSVVGDMFPKSTIATIIGIGGMAGGLGSFLINKGSGMLFTYAAGTTMNGGHVVEMTKELLEQGAEFVRLPMEIHLPLPMEICNLKELVFIGKPAGYFIVFCICGVAYLAGWCIMKFLVPRYKKIEVA